LHDDFTGASPGGFTFLWPAHCSNLFPCHSAPSDGVSFTLAVSGLPAGQSAVYAGTIGPEAPAYQVAWAIGSYTEVPLGSTRAGTQVSVWHQAGEATAALEGTRLLVAAFDWFEQNIGPYRFGRQVGTVSVDWPGGSFGGMEHHPRWHIDRDSLADPVLNVHEAAHGWFGNGVRLRCWEDFVLSEGTSTYLAARALEAVAPEVGAQVWRRYAAQLAVIPGATPVWPSTCGQVGVVEAGLPPTRLTSAVPFSTRAWPTRSAPSSSTTRWRPSTPNMQAPAPRWTKCSRRWSALPATTPGAAPSSGCGAASVRVPGPVLDS
jgi:hypothetical protein